MSFYPLIWPFTHFSSYLRTFPVTLSTYRVIQFEIRTFFSLSDSYWKTTKQYEVAMKVNRSAESFVHSLIYSSGWRKILILLTVHTVAVVVPFSYIPNTTLRILPASPSYPSLRPCRLPLGVPHAAKGSSGESPGGFGGILDASEDSVRMLCFVVDAFCLFCLFVCYF